MSIHKIVVLGPSGSGKTTYLASMYERLKIQRQETTFFLQPSLNQGNELGRLYQGLMKGQLPDKTLLANTQTWSFECKVTTGKGTFSAFQLDYLDYAGERLTDQPVAPGLDPNPGFHQAMEEADSVVGLLDGLKIYEYMQDSSKLTPLYENISAVMKHIQANRNHMRSPVHFILTKWDIFGSGDQMAGNDVLRQVREVLMKFDDFRDFITNRPNPNAPIRIIPISSLGKGYMALQPNGTMRPVPGAIPHPFQVEVPIACALIDKMREEITAVAEKANLHSMADQGGNILHKILVGVLKSLNTAQIRRALPERFREVDEELLAFLRDMVVNETTKRAEQLRQWQASSLQEVKNQQTAFNHVLENFAYLERKLEETYPSSSLVSIQ
jgi:hypothetical protein